MSGIISDSQKKGKKLARDIARQMAREPLEILKSAGEQVAGREEQKPREEPLVQTDKPETGQNEALGKHLEVQGQRQIKALEQEMKEIRVMKEQTEKQKQVVANQPAAERSNPLIEPSLRPKRGLFTGLGNKLQAKRQKERVENPVHQG